MGGEGEEEGDGGEQEYLVEGGHPGTLIALEEETHRVRLVVTHGRRRMVWKVLGQPRGPTITPFTGDFVGLASDLSDAAPPFHQ